MGRRRRKKIKRVRRVRKLTSIRYFECPICGQPTLTIDFEKLKDKPGYKKAVIKCGSCGFHLEMEVPDLLDRIDVYNRVVDMVYEGKIGAATASSGEGESTGGDELGELLKEALGEEAGLDEGEGSGGATEEEEQE